MKVYKLFIMITIGITLFGMLIVPALSSPVSQNVILQYGDTIEEKQAVDELKRLNPSSTVVSVQDISKGLVLQRSFGKAIFVVGHGSEQGIHANGKTYSWEEVTQLAESSNNQKIFFVACNSETVTTKSSSKFVYGFSGEIEPVLGALIVSYLYTQDSTILTVAVDRVFEILDNPDKFGKLAVSWQTSSYCGWFTGCWSKGIWLITGDNKNDLDAQLGAIVIVGGIIALALSFIPGAQAIGGILGAIVIVLGIIQYVITLSDENRADNAYAFGFMVDPFGTYMIVDYGNDNYGADGVVKFPILNFLGLFFAYLSAFYSLIDLIL